MSSELPAPPPMVAGIDLNEERQLALLTEIAQYHDEVPWTGHKQPHLRYYFDNDYYSYSDAVFYYSVLRHFKPSRVIEVGSGFSSMVALDVREQFLGNELKLTCIEPYPDRLNYLMKPSDRVELLQAKVQDLDVDFASDLQANDVLFIDSSHIFQTGSDVCFLLFEVLPRLQKGVLIHFHDVFYPFVYPTPWVLDGRGWNEQYALRAFLQFNSAFSILLFNTFLQHFHHEFFVQKMPLCTRNPGGSIWLQKQSGRTEGPPA